MAIAHTIETFLNSHHVSYDVQSHTHTPTSLKTAAAAGIDPERLAKAVLLQDDNGYVIAVLPATHHVRLGELRHATGRNIHMADEQAAARIFTDCEPGAIPALGMAYGIDTIWDDSLLDKPDIYFEAGDHMELIHLSSAHFLNLLGAAQRGHFARHI
jgi:Ala-tRNA(Pro) deacylase